jgi:nucleotide-binding universal stress UspA family protein
MEEERQQIEALLSQQPKSRRPPSINNGRSPSPYVTARSPMRSMLDVAGAPKHSPTQAHTHVRSMLDIDSPVPAAVTPVRSMLDIGGTPPPMPKSPAVSSAQTSPTLSSHRVPAPGSDLHIRSMSDATAKPVLDFGPRSPPLHRNVDPTSAYKFSDIYATNVGQARPGSRISQPSRSSSIGEALRGSDLSNLVLPGEFGRQFNSLRGKSKSKSPSNRFNLRSNSPHGSLLGRSSSRNQDNGTIMLEDGQIIDKNSAYRRLSDANLIYGGSSLSSLPRKKSDPDGHGRIPKLNMSPYGEILTDDDSDDDVGNSSDEENHRGRKLTTRAESEGGGEGRAAKSLLAAAEDESKLFRHIISRSCIQCHANNETGKQIASQHKYKSLLDDPEITVTNPNGERKKSSKRTVQPATSFDQAPPSRSQTPDPNADQDNLDNSAITRAQNLQLSSTAIISTPEVHRSIRIIYRGEFGRIQRSAEEEHRRLRKYLVATDLSDESTHALEWAIGTVLRDGDTLIAIYCMDEEASGSSIEAANLVPDDPKSMREQAAAINAMAKSTKQPFASNPSHFHLTRPSPSPLVRTSDSGSNTPSPAPSFRGKSKLEEERERAVQDITDRVSKLLRKTQLEVRVIVECIHCKNPKHLITEVIDLVNPTLVVLGSRGRSALKG